ncbi:VOC family protein [Paucibacter sp. Y2R2-4]|uniref:VOC family protein n=1 Tax=Paucibacter sp. Y2R2-4 TaxID=2893553 RepID=UPI0021E479A6|nr:VOC family protein [Paucibacter sp. Y2R2-4]MCV2351342.1 VOC family protein [Paucibacter sp. Y2R2-4]
MIGYTTLGTNDLPRAAAFYDALFEVIGIKRMMDFGRGYAWGLGMDKPGFGVMLPYNQEPATVGNGVMVALTVDSRAKVDALHAKALALGGQDEGAPGLRGEGFYAAYFRDLVGNKLNAFCVG